MVQAMAIFAAVGRTPEARAVWDLQMDDAARELSLYEARIDAVALRLEPAEHQRPRKRHLRRIVTRREQVTAVDAQRQHDLVLLEIGRLDVEHHIIGKADAADTQILDPVVGDDHARRTEIIIGKGGARRFRGRRGGVVGPLAGRDRARFASGGDSSDRR